MIWPKKLTIGSARWTLRLRKRLTLDGQSLRGLTDPDKKTIYLEKGNEDEMLKTLLHEVIHVIIGSRLRQWEGLEEDICYNLEEGLLSFLTRNKEIPLVIASLNEDRHQKS